MTGTSDWADQIAAARRQGDHLAVCDIATRALVEHPDAIAFEYEAILALARAGSTLAARAGYDSLTATGRRTGIDDPALTRDFATLDGRIWKDLAVMQDPAAARLSLRRAAAAYAAVHDQFGGHYPAINAATLSLASGDRAAAERYATLALADAKAGPADYWSTVSQAEALLILGDQTGAAARLGEARALGGGNHDARATTRRQLAWVARLMAMPVDILAALPGPWVGFWTGVEGAWDAAAVARRGGAIVFGPLLSAEDLDVAEALLAADAEVNLVLPCDPETWIATVSPRLAAERVHAALARARSVLLVTAEGGIDEPAARALCAQQARGLAVLRAEALAVDPEPLFAQEFQVRGGTSSLAREGRAIVFGDVRGFSKLSEASQLLFLEHVIGGFADVLGASADVNYAETAGDGLYLVISDVHAAAEICFALRETLRAERLAAAGLPPHLALRLSAHVGPLHRRFDRVIGREKFCGMEVIRTARIEPVTPPGDIFVTEQFAAVLASTQPDGYVCEYAGRQPMAKGFGECRMYSLRRRRIGT